MSKPYEKYSEQFKKKVVELVESGKKRSEIARAYGISAPIIRVWQQKYGSLTITPKKNETKNK